MSSKAFKKDGVFYLHATRKWIYRLRDKWGRLQTSQSYAKHSLAQEAYDEACK